MLQSNRREEQGMVCWLGDGENLRSVRLGEVTRYSSKMCHAMLTWKRFVISILMFVFVFLYTGVESVYMYMYVLFRRIEVIFIYVVE